MAKKKYEKYLVTTPKLHKLAYHAAGEVRGFQYPYQVYVQPALFPDVFKDVLKGRPVFIDVNWRFEIPYPNPISEPHAHQFDQFLFYIGSDWNNPQDLGAELEIQLDDERYIINKTAAIFVPRGVTHTATRLRVDRPFISLGVSSTGEYL